MVCGKVTDLLSIHAQYFANHKVLDVSLDFTGTYIQMLLAEMGCKMSTFGIKVLIVALIAIV